jgi:hypothetical protein
MPTTLRNLVLLYEVPMKTFELAYEFPLGSGKIVKRDVQAETQEQALRDAGVRNPTLTATEVTRPVVVRTKNGRVKVLKQTNVFVEKPDFIDALRVVATIRLQTPQHSLAGELIKYEALTGEKADESTEHISIIAEESKYAASWTVQFPRSIAALAPAYLNAYCYVHTDPDGWAISNNAFVRELLSIGFRLGSNHVHEDIGLALTP